MGVFDRQIANAIRVIQKKGQVVTWRQLSDGAPADMSKPWKPGETVETEVEVSIVFLPETQKNLEFLRLIMGTTVPTGNLTGLMAAQNFTPKVKDIVVRDGIPLGVCSVDPLAPNGDIILYSLRFDL